LPADVSDAHQPADDRVDDIPGLDDPPRRRPPGAPQDAPQALASISEPETRNPAREPPEGRRGADGVAGSGQRAAGERPAPQAMLEVWNQIMEGTPIPTAEMTGRRAGQLAQIARHKTLTDGLPSWRGYCKFIARDTWCRGDRSGRPVTIEQAATVELIERLYAQDQATRKRNLEIFGTENPPVSDEQIPDHRQDREEPDLETVVGPEGAATIRETIRGMSISGPLPDRRGASPGRP
jgi:hypothetical protein